MVTKASAAVRSTSRGSPGVVFVFQLLVGTVRIHRLTKFVLKGPSIDYLKISNTEYRKAAFKVKRKGVHTKCVQ